MKLPSKGTLLLAGAGLVLGLIQDCITQAQQKKEIEEAVDKRLAELNSENEAQ